MLKLTKNLRHMNTCLWYIGIPQVLKVWITPLALVKDLYYYLFSLTSKIFTFMKKRWEEKIVFSVCFTAAIIQAARTETACGSTKLLPQEPHSALCRWAYELYHYFVHPLRCVVRYQKCLRGYFVGLETLKKCSI